MKYIWQELPKRLNVFTTRNAFLVDLQTGKIVQYYSSNTRITLVEKCVTPEKTYYRTESSVRKDLDWAFEAAAFGLPNEEAPSAPQIPLFPQSQGQSQPLVEKQTPHNQGEVSKDGEKQRPRHFWRRIFRKNS